MKTNIGVEDEDCSRQILPNLPKFGPSKAAELPKSVRFDQYSPFQKGVGGLLLRKPRDFGYGNSIMGNF